ncbi:MAG: FAD-binding oxidoreductase [Deltaproteobacteria bacterium]|jgi:glycolate oxidase FAD binding subunit|nr:FAD-binding oxidoreductase [Deltaproteobacteria bacterium]
MSGGDDVVPTGGGPRMDRVAVPGAVVERFHEPDGAAEVARVIARTAREGGSLLVAGGRTRLHWANPARPLSEGLSLRGLRGIDEFEPEEGVLHARAGTPVAEVREVTEREGWELGFDPPGASSTIGGVIATAVTGPRAQCFGRVADSLLGLELVGADGVVSKCGGRVVKNVTGYDMAKLYCGSFGTLGVVTGAWLRLRPAPAIRCAFEASPAEHGVHLEACRRLAELGSVRAFLWLEGGGGGVPSIELELAGSEAEVAHDRAEIEAGLPLVEIPFERIDARRDARAEPGDDGVVLRARVLARRVGELAWTLRATGLRLEIEPGLGVVHARGALETPADLQDIRTRAESLGGLATFEVLPEAWRARLDVFGAPGGSVRLMAEIKRRFDPAGVLNPGRFVAGI